MKNRYAALIAGITLLAGAGGAYTYTHQTQTVTRAGTTVSTPLDPSARDLAGHKADASAKRQQKHAAATAARQAAAQRAAQGGYEPSTDPADGGRTPRTPVGQPCDGDPGTYHVTQPDGTCSGPVHYGPRYFDNRGNPCVPGDQPCSDDDIMAECPSGAATSPRCDLLIKGGEPNMQPPKCGDGSTPAYLRAHGLHCR